MNFAVSTYCFRSYLKSGEMTLLDVVDKAADLGFAGIEFTDIAKDLPYDQRLSLAAQLRRRASERGIAIVCYSVGANLWQPLFRQGGEIRRIMREVEIAAALGAPVMRHDLVWKLKKHGRGSSFWGMLPRLAHAARKIADYAATRGVKTCSENHGLVAQDSDRMEAVVRAVGHSNYGLLVDFGNFLCVDEEPRSAVSRVAPYAIHAHAKDLRRCNGEEVACIIKTRGGNSLVGEAVGEGDVPVCDCLAILRKAGYSGFVTLEYDGNGDALAVMQRSLARLCEYVK